MSRRRLITVAILVTGCLAFGRVLGDYFVMDDFQLLERVSRTRWVENFRSWPSLEGLTYYWLAPLDTNPAREPAYFRPLQDVTYWWIFHAWRMNAFPYHLAALLLHLVVSVLVFRMALRLTRYDGFAALAGLLFAAHPAHTEAVQWVAALSDPLATLFALLAFRAWFREICARSTGPAGGPPRERRPRTWSALAWYLPALLCKESAVALPLLLLGTALLPESALPDESLRTRFARIARCLWPFWVITAGYVLLHLASTAGLVDRSHGSGYVHSVTEPGFPAYALFNFAAYLWNLLLPLPIFPVDVRDLVPSPWVLVGAALGMLAMLGALARLALRHVAGGVFFALWPGVAILPVLPIAPGQRFLYMASVGFCWGAALSAQAYWERRGHPTRRVGIAAGAVLAAYLIAANVYQAFWGIPGDVGRDLVRDIQRQAPSIRRGSEIYLVNLWAPAVRIPDAVRLEYGDPGLQVEVLSCSPKIIPIREGERLNPVEGLFCRFIPAECGPSPARAAWTDAGTLRLWLEGDAGFGSTMVESMLPTRPPPLGQPRVRPRFTARVTRLNPTGEWPSELEFRFEPLAPGAERLFFEHRGGHLYRMPVPGALPAARP